MKSRPVGGPEDLEPGTAQACPQVVEAAQLGLGAAATVEMAGQPSDQMVGLSVDEMNAVLAPRATWGAGEWLRPTGGGSGQGDRPGGAVANLGWRGSSGGTKARLPLPSTRAQPWRVFRSW